MTPQNVMRFPVHYPELFSPEINRQVVSSGEFHRVLSAAIRVCRTSKTANADKN